MSTHSRVGERDEDGFTLIELLVVIVIIGILAAIAIPLFLSQKERSIQTSMRSDLRNAASYMETYFLDEQTYPTSATVVFTDLRPASGTVITVVAAPSNLADTYCLTATNPATDAVIAYDSDKGGLLKLGESCS